MTRPVAFNATPPASAFALAADLLEASTCVSLLRGHLLSAAWALAKACTFWLLHAGLSCLPGRHDLQKYRTYHIGSPVVPSRPWRTGPAADAFPRMTPGTPASDAGPADKDEHRTSSVPGACQNEPSARLEREQSPLDPAKTQRSRGCRTRGSCVDLCIASNPRALTVTRSARLSDWHTRSLRSHGKHIGFVVDSGCTFHIHPHLRDLINVQPCTESVSGVDGRPRPCVAVGDLPLTVRDSRNRLLNYTLTGVRCVPSMRDSLLSVSQLWSTADIDCQFANIRALQLPPDANGRRTLLPFIRRGGLFEWHVIRSDPPATRARTLAIHFSKATSHIQ
eukprot:5869820-Pleurochrysis_carterae.AAC.1